MTKLWLHEVLPGLPGHGPEALPFSPTGQGTHREGYVVRVSNSDGSSWIGNFQPGDRGIDGVFRHPNQRDVIVVSVGQGYAVNAARPQSWSHFGGNIADVVVVEPLDQLVFGDGILFDCIGASGHAWQTKRLSWDGMRDVKRDDCKLHGEAFDPMTNSWMPFTVNLRDGSVVGGSY